ncbi:MAG TPA: hypothetical protein PK450_10030 [Paracoccaceae bacterium]|nr:hypothetical protein [Paracoccaceae bacterium]
MGVVEDLADALAVETLKAMGELENDRFYTEVARIVGASSPTLQEAFMTSVRIRLAAARGHKFLEETLRAKREGGKAPEAPRDTSAH